MFSDSTHSEHIKWHQGVNCSFSIKIVIICNCWSPESLEQSLEVIKNGARNKKHPVSRGSADWTDERDQRRMDRLVWTYRTSLVTLNSVIITLNKSHELKSIYLWPVPLGQPWTRLDRWFFVPGVEQKEKTTTVLKTNHGLKPTLNFSKYVLLNCGI